MAKGQVSKEEITKKLLSTFDGAFIAADGKTIRIPMNEGGEAVEIKVTLTAAKDLEGSGGAFSTSTPAAGAFEQVYIPEQAVPTEEEKENVGKMLAALGVEF